MHTFPRSIIAGVCKLAILSLVMTGLVQAQVPDTLKATVTPPPGEAQPDARFGSSIAIDGGLVVVGAPFVDMGNAYDSGVVKIFDSATGALLHIIPNPEPGNNDRFGWAVAISGTRVVVGLPGKGDLLLENPEHVYVYDMAGATPTIPVLAIPSPMYPGAEFGKAVAISGTRIVVGAPTGQGAGVSSGTAFVYDLSSASPAQPIVTLQNPSLTPDGGLFGCSVAISGTRAVVGAFGAYTAPHFYGSAYVYDFGSATPASPVVALTNPSGSVTFYGVSVAIEGTRVVVGDPQDYGFSGNIYSGRCYVFDLTGATPAVPVLSLKNGSSVFGTGFGYCISISGTQILIGSQGGPIGRPGMGSARVFDLASATPEVPVTTMTYPSPDIEDYFACAVGLSDQRAIVGAYGRNSGGYQGGGAYLYHLDGDTPASPVAEIISPSPSVGDNFAHTMAMSGTLLAVGIPNARGAAGSVAIYDLAASTPSVPSFVLPNPNPAFGDQFGWAVASSGTRVVVGARLADYGASNAGRAYVYDLAGATPAIPILTLNNPSPATGDFFGSNVAIDGTRIAIGVGEDDTGGTNAGNIYVYDLASPNPATPTVIQNPTPKAGEYFGSYIAISGSRLAVGSGNEMPATGNSGLVYIYDLSSATPGIPALTIGDPSPAYDGFGGTVAIENARLVVSATRQVPDVGSVGAFYVFDLGSSTPATPTAVLTQPGEVQNGQFAYRLALSGSQVVASAFSLTGDGYPYYESSVFVFDLNSATPSIPTAILSNPKPVYEDLFGDSIAVSGNTVVIGDRSDDSITQDKGIAYIFGPASNDTDGDGLLDLWEHARFGSTVGHSAVDDGDGDGLNELLELAFNRDPLKPDAGSNSAVVNEGGYLTTTIAKRSGVNYLVQSSATPDAPAFSAATTTVLLDNATTLKVRDNVPIATPGSRFMRVKVTTAP